MLIKLCHKYGTIHVNVLQYFSRDPNQPVVTLCFCIFISCVTLKNVSVGNVTNCWILENGVSHYMGPLCGFFIIVQHC